jgi:hypothetical protein
LVDNVYPAAGIAQRKVAITAVMAVVKTEPSFRRPGSGSLSAVSGESMEMLGEINKIK